MEKRKNKKKSILVLLLLLLVGISIGYAALTSNLNINGNTKIKKAEWDVHFENLVKSEGSESADKEAVIDASKTLIEYTVKLPEPGDFYEFTVDIVNKGSIDASVSEVLKTGLTADQAKYIEYTAVYTDGVELKENDSLKAGDRKNITVRVKYKDDLNPEDLPTEDKSIDLSFQVIYVQENGKLNEDTSNNLYSIIQKDAVADNIASEYVKSSTGIDFGQISSDTNGKGLYLLASSKDANNPIYYYRGAVDNNNVKFANFCWKIVRTTETGGVKLIYNGYPDENGYCTNTTGDATSIGKANYNLGYSNSYLGYMYGTSNASTYEEIHKNVNDSEIKKVVDNWYKDNMISYTSKLEDTIWCNDRSAVSDSIYPGDGTNNSTRYGAGSRLEVSNKPSLECVNLNDRFTVDSANGNGSLTYPVALLTADEMSYAGGVFGINNDTYFLNTNSIYWSLSPHSFIAPGPRMHVIGSRGGIESHYSSLDSSTYDVRPSISLKSKTKISEGDGTASSPYIVK
ncbi:MAG: hypothetical protein J6B89_01015 [Bacilli bacterium]|nr:hypothetical protein [Bacilli bacterium]